MGEPAAKTLLGTKLVAFDVQTRSTRISFDVKSEFLNILGGVRGGFVAAMLDEAAGVGARLSFAPATVLPSLDFASASWRLLRWAGFSPKRAACRSAVG